MKTKLTILLLTLAATLSSCQKKDTAMDEQINAIKAQHAASVELAEKERDLQIAKLKAGVPAEAVVADKTIVEVPKAAAEPTKPVKAAKPVVEPPKVSDAPKPATVSKVEVPAKGASQEDGKPVPVVTAKPANGNAATSSTDSGASHPAPASPQAVSAADTKPSIAETLGAGGISNNK
jgi:outer membrane biosynthesis protein TonB